MSGPPNKESLISNWSFTRSLWTRFATLYRTLTAANRFGESAV
jgi:hypothetical protein